MTSYAHSNSHSDPNVIHLDLASQKLLVKPDDPIPEFYPPPRAVMVTPIYNDDAVHGQQPPLSAGGSDRGYRSHRDRDRGRRYYDNDYDDYERGRRFRNEPRRGGYSDDESGYGGYDRGRGFDDGDDMGDRKRSRVPGTEPPPLPPPDISQYPGGSGSGGHGRHGRAQSQSYGRYDRDYGRYDRPQHQSNKLRKGRSRDGYGRRGRGDDRDRDDYPPPSDYDSDDYYPDDRYPDDDSNYSYSGAGGRGGYAKRSRPQGTEPPKLPPPDISGYPGGGHGGGGGGGSHVQGVPGVHEGAGSAPGSHGGGGGGGHGTGYAGSQYPASQQGHGGGGGGYAGSQYSQQPQQQQYQQQQQYPPQHQGKKPGLIGRIFSGSTRNHPSAGVGAMGRQGAYPHSGGNPAQFMASHRPSAVPGRPAPMHMSSSDSSAASAQPGGAGGGHGAPGQGGAALAPKMKLSPITQAFLRIAAKKGYGDEITRYINQLPPNPQFCWSRCNGGKKAVLIGINYVGMKDELKGCANDARNMRDFLVSECPFLSSVFFFPNSLPLKSWGFGGSRPRRSAQLSIYAPIYAIVYGKACMLYLRPFVGIYMTNIRACTLLRAFMSVLVPIVPTLIIPAHVPFPYPHFSMSPLALPHAVLQAHILLPTLSYTWHFNPANIVLITDEKERPTQLSPTRREMFNAMAWLVHDAKPNDSLFFHYSGHGGQSKDASGREADGLDEVIYPLDYDDAGDVIDDELHSALVTPLPAGVRLTAVFDSCHSGGVLDLPYLHSAHGRLRSMQHVSKRAQQRGGADPADVLCIAACKSDETSADTHEGNVAVGAMSYALIQSMKTNPDQTYAELLSHLREILIPKYNQKAQMSGTHPLDLDRKFIL
ncbi:hypothetical protein D9619_010178 [Psilocybe cf. subviscida]|uniref:Peptidase C14 caspase domain-containing protein n=1 Tax=Psilocybe cf. subviscida TaxID=2480587 RepID=A0A8H5ERZ8_9AGAR|nr:hypothetical protein D9619_010178 [Psilocybe cf. subviscida]